MTKVFLSYVRENKDQVKIIVEKMQNKGIEVFWDANLKYGDEWKEKLRQEIKVNDFFILIISKELCEREESYVYAELEIAKEKMQAFAPSKRWFIPFLLDDVDFPQVKLGVGKYIDDFHAVPYHEDPDRIINTFINQIGGGITSEFEYTCHVCSRKIDLNIEFGFIYIDRNEVWHVKEILDGWEKRHTKDGVTSYTLKEADVLLDTSAHWKVSHYECFSEQDSLYNINLHRMLNYRDIVSWTAHLSMKNWLKYTDWFIFISTLEESQLFLP